MGTSITVLVLVVCFALVIRYMWRKHKRGETSCGRRTAHVPVMNSKLTAIKD